MPAARLGEGECVARGVIGPPQPALGQLQRGFASEAAQQQGVALALDGERRGTVESLGRDLQAAVGELGGAVVEERERTQRVAVAPGLGVEQDRRRLLLRERDVAAGAGTQQHREPAGVAVVRADRGEPRLGAGGIAQREPRRRSGHRQPGVVRALGDRGDRLGGDDVEQQVEPVVGDQRGGRAHAAGGERVGQRLAAESGADEPLGGARVELRLEAGALEPQPRPQQLREQPVVAEPGAVAVERDHERTFALELLERERAVGAAGQRVRQLAADAAGDARAQQQLARRLGQSGQHLAGQVVGDGAIVAGELGHERVRVGLAAQGQPGEAEPRGPALRALEQTRDERGPEREPQALEQRGRLLEREREVGGAQLAQAAGQPQARERELRIGAGRRHHVQRVAAVDEQLAQRGERRAAQQVEVVEHEHRALRRTGQRVGEPQRDVVVERDVLMAQRLAHVRPQPSRLGVARAEGQPGRVVVRRPAAEQHGLAPTGRRLHEGDRAGAPRVERSIEPRARDRGRGDRGDGRADGVNTAHCRLAHRSGGGRAMARAGVCGASAHTSTGVRAPSVRLRSWDPRAASALR